MAQVPENPYTGTGLAELWEMCVRRDLEAFLAADWSVTANDFLAEGFLGIDAGGSSDPLDWQPAFTTLASYRDEFEQQAAEFQKKRFACDARLRMYAALTLMEPKISGDTATIVKVFDGQLELEDGAVETLAWKSLFFLRKKNKRWLFNGFVGYLPLSS